MCVNCHIYCFEVYMKRKFFFLFMTLFFRNSWYAQVLRRKIPLSHSRNLDSSSKGGTCSTLVTRSGETELELDTSFLPPLMKWPGLLPFPNNPCRSMPHRNDFAKHQSERRKYLRNPQLNPSHREKPAAPFAIYVINSHEIRFTPAEL